MTRYNRVTVETVHDTFHVTDADTHTHWHDDPERVVVWNDNAKYAIPSNLIKHIEVEK